MIDSKFIEPELAERLASLAWTWTWQVTLIAAVVGFVSWRLRYRAPRVMYALWIVVLIKCLVPPIIESPFAWTEKTTRIFKSAPAVQDTPDAQTPSMNGYEIALPLKPIARSKNDPAMSDSLLAAPATDLPTAKKSSRDALQSGSLKAKTVTAKTAKAETASPDGVPAWKMNIPSSSFILATIWLSGWLASLVLTQARTRRITKRMQAGSVTVPAWLTELLEDSRDQLNISRRIELRVSDAVSSPMIMGLIRPTIYLPSGLAHDPEQRDSLDVILAHELIHLKRRDLHLGLLQQLVMSLWWFHPLVWFASRQLSLQCELLCDRAVLVHLGCTPSNYAHRLLNVLQNATQTSAPTLPHSIAPGMSAFGRTQLRLERIMKTNPNSRRRWDAAGAILAIVLAAVILPGDFTAKAQEKTTSAPNATEAPMLPEETETDQAAPERPPITQTQKQKIYPSVIARTATTRFQLGEGDFETQRTKFIPELQAFIQSASDDQAPTIVLVWEGDNLKVKATETQHQRIADFIAERDLSNAPQIAIELQMLDVDHADITSLFQAIGMDWYALVDTPVSLQKRPTESPTEAEAHLAAWSSSMQQEQTNATPLLISFISPAVKKALINLINDRPRLSVMYAPKVTMFDGQKAMVTDGTTTPFTTSLKRNGDDQYEPKVQMIPEGLGIELMPQMLNGETVNVKLWQKRTEVLSVSTFRLASRISSPDLQTPQLLTRRFAADLTMQEGDTALVAWIEAIADDQPKVHMTMLTPKVVLNADKIKTSGGIVALPTDSDESAMKYGLLPLMEFPKADAVGAEEPEDVPEWKQSQLSPVPLTRELRKALEHLDAELTTDNLTTYTVNKDGSVLVEGDMVTLAIHDECGIVFMEMSECAIASKSMRLSVNDKSLTIEFDSQVEIAGDPDSECKVTGNQGSMTIAYTPDSPIKQLALNLSGDAKLEFDDISLSAEKFNGTFTGYTAEGNVTMTARLDGKQERTLTGSKLSVSEDFPVFIIEREPGEGSKTAP